MIEDSIRLTGKQCLLVAYRIEKTSDELAAWRIQMIGRNYHGMTLKFPKLAEWQLDALESALTKLLDLRGLHSKPTRRSARKHLAKLQAWRQLSAVDRLGDIVR